MEYPIIPVVNVEAGRLRLAAEALVVASVTVVAEVEQGCKEPEENG